MSEVQQPRIQFGVRTLIEMITVVALVLALIYGKSNWGSGGRYQMQTTSFEKGTIVTDVFLIHKRANFGDSMPATANGIKLGRRFQRIEHPLVELGP